MNGPLMSRNSHTFRLQPIKCKKLVHFANKFFSLALIHSRQLMVGIEDQSVYTFCFKSFKFFFNFFAAFLLPQPWTTLTAILLSVYFKSCPVFDGRVFCSIYITPTSNLESRVKYKNFPKSFLSQIYFG